MRTRTPNVLPAMRDWYDCNVPKPPPFERPAQPAKTPKVYTDATEYDRRALDALQSVTIPPATTHKRFTRDMAGAEKLTQAQRDLLWRIVWRFRRQITDKSLVECARARGGAA